MNRIEKKFIELKKEGRTAFIPYLTCGYPDIETTEKLVLGMEKAGADIIELGIPFSDPVADGPVIQFSSQEALKKGVNLKRILGMVSDIRKRTEIPLVLMGYCNTINAYGEKKFIRDAAKKGVDGLIIADLPADEGKKLSGRMEKNGIDLIFLVAPTSSPERTRKIAELSRGYVYYVSLTGVTGARKKLPSGIKEKIRQVSRLAAVPVCVGFGISTPGHVKLLKNAADGIIVGSAIIRKMRENAGKGMEGKVLRFAKALADGCGGG